MTIIPTLFNFNRPGASRGIKGIIMWKFDRQKLQTARKARRISLRNLEKLSGVDRSNISRAERGEQTPNAASLARLASALGMNPGDFFTK
jgi:predicted transcriptional regulator